MLSEHVESHSVTSVECPVCHRKVRLSKAGRLADHVPKVAARSDLQPRGLDALEPCLGTGATP